LQIFLSELEEQNEIVFHVEQFFAFAVKLEASYPKTKKIEKGKFTAEKKGKKSNNK
jgi:hypothetical protein